MSTSKVVSLKKIGLAKFISENKLLILLCAAFVTGILIGTVTYSKNDFLLKFVKSTFDNIYRVRNQKAILKVILSVMISYLTVSAITFCAGTSMMGIVLVPIIDFLLGFKYGSISAFLYGQYALKGVAFNAVILIPPAAVFTVALIFTAKETINFSLLLCNLTFPKTPAKNVCVDFKRYCGKFLILFLIIIFASLFDAVLCRFFIHFFDF